MEDVISSFKEVYRHVTTLVFDRLWPARPFLLLRICRM